jgi:hypothetical protein
MAPGDITAKLRHLLRPKHDYRDPAADADDLAPLAEDRPPTLAADIRPGAGEHRHGTRASRPDPPPR